MARLEIPSIVVHKGCRSETESKLESPCTVVRESKMPSLPASKEQDRSLDSSSSSNSDMIETDMIGNLQRSASLSINSSSKSQDDIETKNNRNRSNSKVKLLVRSHAMRESTSPPREPENDLIHRNSPQTMENTNEDPRNSPIGSITSNIGHSNKSNFTSKNKSFSANSNRSGNTLNTNQFDNNNEPIFGNSNLGASNQSPKRIYNSATSLTYRTSTRSGSSNSSQIYQKNGLSPPNGNKSDSLKGKQNTSNLNLRCNNCVNDEQHERPVLLRTPISSSKDSQKKLEVQNSQKNEQRRFNTLNVCNTQCLAQCSNTLSINRSNYRHKLRHQNSSQGSLDSTSPSLSRDNSTEFYTDSTGIDLEQFIAETINRNQKDRTVLLKIEKDLIEFIKDRQKVSHKFPNMSSYNRMLVHRVAAYFGMEHNVDQSGLSVIVTRTKNMRIPDLRFKEHIHDDLLLTEEPRRSILKRDSSSFEDSFNFKSPDRMSGDYCRRSKSFEEREEEYERARRRIFKDSSGESSEVASWPYWSSSESSDVSARYRFLHPPDHPIRQTRLSKGESLDENNSFCSNDLRPLVSKSFSFGGYTRGMLSRGDSVISTHSAGARLMKQDSGASVCSRVSPSSSGYKSQSQRSDATISPSPSPSPIANITRNHSRISSQSIVSPEPNTQTIMWAVTNISSVPLGSIIINPQTNQPYTNPDGSLYRFDPDNPPKLFTDDTDGPNKVSSKYLESSGSHRTVSNNKNEPLKKQRSHTSICHSGSSSCESTTTIKTTTTTTATTTTATLVTNSSTSPSLPFTPPPAPPPPPPPPPPPLVYQQLQQHQQQQLHPLIKAVTVQPYNHNQTIQPYASYISTSEHYSKSVYPSNIAQQTVIMAPHPSHNQPSVQNNCQEEICSQNSMHANYILPVQQPSIQQTGDITELSNCFVGMNIYDQRSSGDGQAAISHSCPQSASATNQTLSNIQPMQTNYWQTSINQMPVQQAMYFMPPGTAITFNQNPNEKQQLTQQQRLTTTYSINLPTPTPPSQTNANHINNYPITYNSISTVTTAPSEYSCQPPVHMVPTYYSGQSGIQSSPIMYRVSTPPNIPTSNQISSIPLMYVNSSNYPPPSMISTGTFGHQIASHAASSVSPSNYITPALFPHLFFRQNLPIVANVRTSTPGSSQRASRSPTPACEFLGGGSGDRSAQPSSRYRYPLPMYQGIHIMQGDMRLIHPGVPGNPRLQYVPVPSPTVQGCSRPYGSASYSSNTSSGGTPTSFDGKNQKIRKQRSKIVALPLTASRSNSYQSSSMTSLSSNTPKNTIEGKVKRQSPIKTNCYNTN